MTTTPEADLRAALDTSARSARLQIDTAAVLEQGHRALRRRRHRHLAVAAAAVLAVGVGVAGVVESQRASDHSIPATPAPGPVTTLGVIVQREPVAVPSTDVSVTVSYDAARRTGTFVVSRADGSRTKAEVTLDRTLGAGYTVTDAGSDHGVVYLLVPNTMNVRQLPPTQIFRGQWSADGNVASTDLVASVRSLAKNDPGPQLLYATDPERGAMFGDGSQVDTGRMSLGEATVVLWLNSSHRLWGYTESVDGHPTSGGGGSSQDVEYLDAGILQLEGTSGTRDSAGNPVSTSVGTGLLPSGATQVTPVFRGARPSSLTFGSAAMSGEGGVALAVRCTASGPDDGASEAVCRELKGVSWVDRSGTTHFTPLR